MRCVNLQGTKNELFPLNKFFNFYFIFIYFFNF